MHSASTYWANIYCGLLPGYVGHSFSVESAYQICQDYCNNVKLGLTVTKTKFIYVGGSEDGIVVGLINYPRFPSTPEQIRIKAIDLANLLKSALMQERVSVVFPDETIMIGDL